jgi:hypothetical protein
VSCQQTSLTPCLRVAGRPWETLAKWVILTPQSGIAALRSDGHSDQAPIQCLFLSSARARHPGPKDPAAPTARVLETESRGGGTRTGGGVGGMGQSTPLPASSASPG